MRYRTQEEYWRVIEEEYARFARPDHEVVVTDSYYRPNGECQLCGHGIANHFVITNRDTGRTLTVGCNCIENRVLIERKWRDRIRRQRQEAAGQTTLAPIGETEIVRQLAGRSSCTPIEGTP